MSIEPLPGGQGGDPPRSELALERQALRNDWPIPPDVRAKILGRLIDYLDRSTEEGATAPDRTVIAAAKVLAQFANLTVKQQLLDLGRERLAASSAGVDAMDAAAEDDKALRDFLDHPERPG